MRRLDSDYDLADLSVGLQVAERLDDLGEGEGLVDAGLEVAGDDVVEDVFSGLLRFDWVGEDIAQSVALDEETLAECGEERVGSGFCGQSAIFEDGALSCGGFGERFEAFAANGIEDEACALAGGDLVDAGDEVLFIRDDDVIGAKGE